MASLSWLGLFVLLLATPVVYAAVWSRPDRARRAIKVLTVLTRYRTDASAAKESEQEDQP